MKKNEKKNKGFSLIELVIVVAILAILVGILAPQYIKYVEKSRKSADATNVEEVVNAFKVASADDASKLKADTYTFAFSTNADIKVTAAGTGDVDAVIAALKEAAGDNWQSTKLKSEKWGSAVSVTIKYAEDGSCTVTYEPQTLREFIKGETSTNSNSKS